VYANVRMSLIIQEWRLLDAYAHRAWSDPKTSGASHFLFLLLLRNKDFIVYERSEKKRFYAYADRWTM